MRPLVSVIIPAYNAEAHLEETLRSVTSQSYRNLEIIAVDDGSTDGTRAILETWAQKDSRIKVFTQANAGVAAARNLAIAKSTGQYVAPIDADDIWYPAKIERQVTGLEEAGEEVGVCYAWSVSIDEKGSVTDVGPKVELTGKVHTALVLRNFVGNASVPLFRRSALELVGYYNEDLRREDAQGCEDWEITLRLAEKYQFSVVPEYLVGYRIYEKSMSCNHLAMGRSYERVLAEVQARHPAMPAHIFRWSQSIFYLYLTHKSSLAGDLPSAYRWLSQAIDADPAALLLPWVARNFVTQSLRSVLYRIIQDPRVWRQFRRPGMIGRPMSYAEVLAGKYRRHAVRFWDRIQLQRWFNITQTRSFSC